MPTRGISSPFGRHGLRYSFLGALKGYIELPTTNIGSTVIRLWFKIKKLESKNKE
jgi:hypothetical protein